MHDRLRGIALLTPMQRLERIALLLMRVATGGFLIDGVWGNLTDPDRMAEFARFMTDHGFFAAGFWAPFSAYTQCVAGLLLLVGLLTRWAALFVAATFVIALWVVHWEQDLREWWPALSLVTIGLVLGTRGAGTVSLDAILGRSERRRPDQ